MASKSFKKKRSSSSPVASMAYSKHSNRRKIIILMSSILLISAVLLVGISSNNRNKSSTVTRSLQNHGYEVINEFPHDPRAFTQGLVYGGNDTLFESTGLYQRSSVRKVDLRTGKVEILVKMADSYFGEGLTLLGERLFQVTWLTNTGFIYDRKNLKKLHKYTHQMQDGWGLATDGKILYGSDGTSTLYEMDPQTFRVTGKHVIKFNGHDVRYLNELEYINGEIWANIWQSDCIVRISPDNGAILGWIFLGALREGLISAGCGGCDVLNGIAWDNNNNRIFVTGKLWPKLYEIKVHPSKKQYRNEEIEQLCLK